MEDDCREFFVDLLPCRVDFYFCHNARIEEEKCYQCICKGILVHEVLWKVQIRQGFTNV